MREQDVDDELARACEDEELSTRARDALAVLIAMRRGERGACDDEVLLAVREARRRTGTSQEVERAVGRALRSRSAHPNGREPL